MNNSKENQTATRSLRREFLDRRMAGYTILQIAEDMGYAPYYVSRQLRIATRLVDATSELEEQVRIDLGRLETLFQKCWPYAAPHQPEPPDLEFVTICLKILERKSKLLGLDAPKRIDVRAIVQSWAEREGLDPDDVIDAANHLLPAPGGS